MNDIKENEYDGEPIDKYPVNENLYLMLANLRAAGDRDFFKLTATFVATNSIFLAIIGLLLTQDTVFGYTLSFIISLVGIIICFEMYISQGMLKTKIHFWDRNLRLIESHPGWLYRPIFTELDQVRIHQHSLPAVIDHEPPFLPNLPVRLYHTLFGLRLRSFPIIFSGIFITFVAWCLLHIFV